jgi:hypothetical protein
MSFDSIGGISVIGLYGDLAPQGQKSKEISRESVDGRAWLLTSNKGDTTTLTGKVDCNGNSAADSQMSALIALQRSTQTIVLVRNGAETYDNFWIEHVYGFGRKGVVAAIGGTCGGNVLLTFSVDVSFGGTN